MQMLSPEGEIVGTDNIVVLDDSMLIIGTRHSGPCCPGCFLSGSPGALPLYFEETAGCATDWCAARGVPPLQRRPREPTPPFSYPVYNRRASSRQATLA